MMSTAVIGFNVDEDRALELLRLARPWSASTEHPSSIGVYLVEIPTDAPELESLRSALRDAGDDWIERVNIAYSDDELRSAPLLRVGVLTQQGFGGPRYGTVFDLENACPACGTGALQTSALNLAKRELPSRNLVFTTHDGDLLLPERIGRMVEEAGVTGINLRPVREAKSGEELPWMQVLPLSHLGPLDEGAVIEGQCPTCRRDGFFHALNRPVEFRYEAERVNAESLPDVVATYEHFGNSCLREPFSESHFAQPDVLVKPRVFDILRRARVRNVRFTPVRIGSG